VETQGGEGDIKKDASQNRIMIPKKVYKKIVKLMPIVCLDGILTNSKGEYLLVKRKNEPLKGHWFVPGGRLLKGEDLKSGFARKMLEETGARVKNVKFTGIYDSKWDKSPHGNIHTVGLVFQGKVKNKDLKVDNQSSEWKWSKTLPKEIFKLLGGK